MSETPENEADESGNRGGTKGARLGSATSLAHLRPFLILLAPDAPRGAYMEGPVGVEVLPIRGWGEFGPGWAARPMVGATAYTERAHGAITSCRVAMNERFAGKDFTDVLVHELGHCLGLGHTSLAKSQEPSVMYWMSHGPFFSESVTAADLEALRALYR